MPVCSHHRQAQAGVDLLSAGLVVAGIYPRLCNCHDAVSPVLATSWTGATRQLNDCKSMNERPRVLFALLYTFEKATW